MPGRIFGIIALISFLIAMYGLYSIWVCMGGDLTNLAQCQSEMLVTFIGFAITAAAGGGGATAG